MIFHIVKHSWRNICHEMWQNGVYNNLSAVNVPVWNSVSQPLVRLQSFFNVVEHLHLQGQFLWCTEPQKWWNDDIGYWINQIPFRGKTSDLVGDARHRPVCELFIRRYSRESKPSTNLSNSVSYSTSTWMFSSYQLYAPNWLRNVYIMETRHRYKFIERAQQLQLRVYGRAFKWGLTLYYYKTLARTQIKIIKTLKYNCDARIL